MGHYSTRFVMVNQLTAGILLSTSLGMKPTPDIANHDDFYIVRQPLTCAVRIINKENYGNRRSRINANF